MYVGGQFTNANNNGTLLPAADYVARWDGAAWSALGSNGAGNGALNSMVTALAVSGTDLYVGGQFTDVNNNGALLPAADYIAKWDGATWSALSSNGAGNGALNSTVYALAVSGTTLYVGGSFTNANNNGASLPAADYVATWDGANWSALGSNGASNGALNSRVNALAVSGTDLYVGGQFTNVNNNGTSLTAADYIAKWDGANWSALGSESVTGNGASTSYVYALAVIGTDLYVGGVFTNVWDSDGTSLSAADYIAKWDGAKWSALGSNGASGNGALNNTVYALAVSGTTLYVGGGFTNVNNNGTSLPEADYLAQWDGANWSALGSNGAGNGALNGAVNALAMIGTAMYVGGSFTNVNDNGTLFPMADYVAKWDDVNWSALGYRVEGALNNTVLALAVSGTDVYVGGDFTDLNINGTLLTTADYIAKWDGANWSALGSNGAGNGALGQRGLCPGGERDGPVRGRHLH